MLRLLGSSALALVISSPLMAQSPVAAPAVAAAPASAAQVIDAARREVRERYVLPETAARLDEALGQAAAARRFDGLSGEALANAMNAVLREVTADGHLSVSYDPRRSAALAARPPQEEEGEDQGPPPEYVRMVRQMNGGVERLELMPGNIRYLDYRGFMWGTPEAEAAIATAMEFLRGGDALIIDIRRNGGGSPGAVAAIASYFLPPETQLMRFEMRGMPGEASETHAPPFSLADKPLYVLTSKGSFSAAEEFANHVSAFGFGTLVGETTGGGGFRNTHVPLPGGLVMSVSIGRAVHMVTGKDWEGTGIAPAIEVPAERALARAQAEAMTTIAAQAPAAERDSAGRLVTYYRAVADGAEPGRPLEVYAGRYGDRVIALDQNGALTVSRQGRPPIRLVAIGPDLFVPEIAPGQHFRFVAEGGAVTALETDSPDGPVRSPRAAE